MDLDPTRTAPVEDFVGFDGAGDRLGLREYGSRVQGAGGDESDELGDVLAVIAVATPDRQVALQNVLGLLDVVEPDVPTP